MIELNGPLIMEDAELAKKIPAEDQGDATGPGFSSGEHLRSYYLIFMQILRPLGTTKLSPKRPKYLLYVHKNYNSPRVSTNIALSDSVYGDSMDIFIRDESPQANFSIMVSYLRNSQIVD